MKNRTRKRLLAPRQQRALGRQPFSYPFRHWYALQGGLTPVLCADLFRTERLLRSIRKRRVGYDRVGDYRISTVFLCLDHGFLPDAPPLLYETLVMAPDREDIPDVLDGLQWRYRTRDEAVRGHRETVQRVENALASGAAQKAE